MDRSVLRRTIAAVMMLALSLAGIGRGFAAAESGPAFIVIDGFVISLCHTDDGSGGPQDTGHHDCCDQCTLRAASMCRSFRPSRPRLASSISSNSLPSLASPRRSHGLIRLGSRKALRTRDLSTQPLL